MSFQGLISGAECAAASNPLSQVLKHSEGDRSLQQDRIAEPQSARLHSLPGTSSAANEHDLALARQFFEGNAQSPGEGHPFALPYHLPPANVARMAEMNGVVKEAWSIEQQDRIRGVDDPQAKASWAAEFGSPLHLSSAGQHNMLGQSEFQQRPYLSSGGIYHNSLPVPMYGMNMSHNMYQGSHNATSNQTKGKEKSRDAEFEAAFAQVAASLSPTQLEAPSVVEGENDVGEALRNLTLETGDDAAGQSVKRIMVENPSPQEDVAKWEADFNQLMNAQRDELEQDYGDSMQQAWAGGIGDLREDENKQGVQFGNDGLPVLGEYIFEKNNIYLGPSTSTRSALNKAKALLEQNGSLTEAALLLEAAIQKGELGEGGYEAWILLGETKNMDEREDAGMRALVEGVRRAEEAGAAGTGMLSLAISYTNESFDRASHVMLLRWIRARYPSHPIPEDTIKAVPLNTSWDTHTRVTDVFLSLARQQHNDGILDPDVQVGLGILFYTNGEYDLAKDCFQTALTVQPKDYLLWNRLGSSLSNGSKPEEALGAYQEALQLRPTYTRAIYNVGVACLNIGADKEAAEHFLSALAMQESNGAASSEPLWVTLRRAFLSMDRSDLAGMTNHGNRASLEVFRKEGFDF